VFSAWFTVCSFFCTLALSSLFYPPSRKRKRKRRECVYGARERVSSRLLVNYPHTRVDPTDTIYRYAERFFFSFFPLFFPHSQRTASVLDQHDWLTIRLRANDAARSLLNIICFFSFNSSRAIFS